MRKCFDHLQWEKFVRNNPYPIFLISCCFQFPTILSKSSLEIHLPKIAHIMRFLTDVWIYIFLFLLLFMDMCGYQKERCFLSQSFPETNKMSVLGEPRVHIRYQFWTFIYSNLTFCRLKVMSSLLQRSFLVS